MSKPAINPIALQMNVKQNAQDLNSYLKDLQHWSEDVKQKDAALKIGAITLTKTPASSKPIRGSKSVVLPSSESADQQRYTTEKQLGNDAFSSGKYDQAVTHYTQCMLLCPSDPISASNRAQALLKLKRWQEAEADATTAVELDSKHVKSFWRRAQARKELRKYAGAVQDCEKILELEKANAPAQALLKEMKIGLEKQQAARLAASQPIVSATKPIVTPPMATISTATASLPSTVAPTATAGGRRMVIQEEDDDEEEEEVKINTSKPSSTPAKPTAPTPTADSPSKPSSTTPATVATTAAVSSSRPVAPVSPSSVSATSSGLRPPQTAFDFDTAIRSIQKDPQQMAEYFKLIPNSPQTYATLLKTALDGTLLKNIVRSVVQVLQPGREFPHIYSLLHNLTHVPRFSITRMLMDSGDKKALTALLQQMSQLSADEVGANEQQIQQLAKDYGLKL